MNGDRGIKQPPYSLDAEESLLGGLMVNNRAWIDVCDRISRDDLYNQQHKIVWDGIAELLNNRKPCDLITLSEHLGEKKLLDEVDGIAFLGKITMGTPSAANVKAYADIIRRHSIMRSLIGVGTDIATGGYEPDGRSPTDLIEEAEKELFKLRNRGARGSNQAEHYHTLIPTAEQHIDETTKNGGSSGQSTGLMQLDQATTGMHPGDLIIIAGRPGMGKSSLALNIAEHVAIDCSKSTLVFSMEMPRAQLAMRSIAARGHIDLQRIRTGKLDDMDYTAMSRVGGTLRLAPLAIDDTGSLSPNELRARARRHQARYGLALIVVDYIQLMEIPGSRHRETEVAGISRALKSVAKELNVPVIALSQLSRSVESRDGNRPKMSDLRESGGIEQDADVVMLLYRDDYYNPKDSPHKGICEIIIPKQRNGERCVVDVAYVGRQVRFDNYHGPGRTQRVLEGKPPESEAGFRTRKTKPVPPPNQYADD